MKKINKALLSSAALLALAACGKGNSDNPIRSIVEGAKAPELQGTFKSQCVAATDIDGFGFETRRYEFAGDSVTIYSQLGTDSKCVEPSLQIVERGTFKTSDGSAGNRNIDLDIKNTKIEPKTDGAVALLKTANYCSADDWAKNQAKDVTEATKGDHTKIRCWTRVGGIYDIYALQDNNRKLVLGQGTNSDKLDSSKRPTKLGDIVLDKQ